MAGVEPKTTMLDRVQCTYSVAVQRSCLYFEIRRLNLLRLPYSILHAFSDSNDRCSNHEHESHERAGRAAKALSRNPFTAPVTLACMARRCACSSEI